MGRASVDIETLDLEAFMREALAEAEAAGKAGELPSGGLRDASIALLERYDPETLRSILTGNNA